MIFALSGLTAGCASLPQPVALDPVNWLRHVSGDDLRQDCGPESQDHYRLVMNGVSGQITRSVDITMMPEGGALLAAHDLPLDLTSGRGQTSQQPAAGTKEPSVSASARLSDWNAALLIHHMQLAGVFEGGVVGAITPNDQIRWIATGCRQGRSFSTVFASPDPGLGDTLFPSWKK